MIVSPPDGYSIVEFDTGKGRAAVLWPAALSCEDRAALLADLAEFDRAISRGEYEKRSPDDEFEFRLRRRMEKSERS